MQLAEEVARILVREVGCDERGSLVALTERERQCRQQPAIEPMSVVVENGTAMQYVTLSMHDIKAREAFTENLTLLDRMEARAH